MWNAVVWAGGINRLPLFEGYTPGYGVGIIPVIVEHPEITIDVDEAADYEFVVAPLGKRKVE